MKIKLDITNCSNDTAKLMPVVNFNNCGGKEDCVEACPYDVFEMRPISEEDKATLNFKGKIKTFFFNQKAYVINPDQCHACGLCIQVCSEKAVKLTLFIKGD